MKKFLALTLSALILAGALAGCDVKETDEETQSQKETTTQVSEAEKKETTLAQTTEQDEERAIILSAKRVDDAQEFYLDFALLDHEDVILDKSKNPYPEVEKYYLLEDYKTIAEFKKEALSLYSKKVAYENFFKFSENEADWKDAHGPFMIEVDGRAYADVYRFGAGSQLVYEEDTVKVKSVEGNNAVITVDYYYEREPEIVETKEIKMVKENGLWVFDETII